MTIRFPKLHLITMMIVATLAACGETERDLHKARQMSCTELAREIGKREQRVESAQIDGWVYTLTSIISDDDELETAANIGLGASAIEEIDATKSLEQLKEIYSQSDCV